MGVVIQAAVYRRPNGQSVPPYSSYIPPDAVYEVTGWTVRHPDGTVGLGRPPFKTKEVAQAWVDANPRFPGMQQG